MNNTICAAFWQHTNIRAGNQIYACCRYKTPIQKFDGDVNHILFSKNYDNLRKESINGIKNTNCEKCYYEESLGKESLRQQFNQKYSIDSIVLKFLEIGFDNICNLTCNGCWEEWSHSWWVKKNPDKIPKEGILTTNQFVNIPKTIEKITFLGGEPLMTNRHVRLLNSLEHRDINISYITNGMFLLNQNTIDLLKKFKNVQFIVSIDGVADVNDNVRQGSNWNAITGFLNQLRDLSFKTSVNTVVHLNNWFDLHNLKNFIQENQYDWNVYPLTYPTHLDIANYPDKEKMKNYFKSFDFPNQKTFLEHIKKEFND